MKARDADDVTVTRATLPGRGFPQSQVTITLPNWKADLLIDLLENHTAEPRELREEAISYLEGEDVERILALPVELIERLTEVVR